MSSNSSRSVYLPSRQSLGRLRNGVGRQLIAGLAVAVAAGLLIPLAFLILQAVEVGWSKVSPMLFRPLTLDLLWNTVRLTMAVTVICALLAVSTAWCIERTDLPFRRFFGVLAVLPLAVPDFVVAYSWNSVAPVIHGFYGATLVMTLGTYPLVYLPVAAALRRVDPALEEVAQSAGMGRLEIFWKVTLPQIRLALLGGSLLLALALLAEYGAFEQLGYQTFTTEIFTEFRIGFDPAAASALSLVLVALGLALILGEMGAEGRGRASSPSRQAIRVASRASLGRATLPVLAGFVVLGVLALGVPFGTLIYWLTSTQPTTLPAASLLSAAGYSALYSGLAAAISTIAALPVAFLVVRRRSALSVALERSTYIVQGLPGLAVALALAFFTIRFVPSIYQTSGLLIGVYALLFFPLALVCVRSSLAEAPPILDEVSRSLGCGPLRTLVRVTLPLIAPGLAAAFALVFLSAMTELTATLVLVPTGVQTLATQFWAYTTDLAYSAAAPFAALIVAISAVPGYLLTRWFARRGDGPALAAWRGARGNLMSEVRISGLRKSFGTDLVLAGVDLVVEDESLTAVLGPSGSGKTTLLRVLAGFVRSDAGRIEIGDEVVVDGGFHVPPERRHIGYVPQEGALFPHLDVAKNVAFGMKRSPERDGRVKEILELVGMSRFHGRYPHELSGGQQQRVALARALAPKPRLLLLDEPFSSLDAQMRTALRLEVAELLRSTETTSVLVTHDQDEAMSIADHVAILARGEVLQSGSPRTLYTRPVGRGIARFVGIANFLFGEIANDGVRTEFGLLDTNGREQIANGSRVVVMIRPERLAIDALDDNTAAGRVEHGEIAGIEGHVTNLEYHGHDVLVFVEPEKSGLFYQRVPRALPGETARPLTPTTRLVVRADGDVVLEPGQKVCVRAQGPVAVWPDPALRGST